MLIRRRILRHGSRITVRDGGLLQRCIDLLGDGDNIAQRLSLIHISEPTRRYAISYAVFCLNKKFNEA